MVRQIIVAVTSAVAAQMAVATLNLAQIDQPDPSRYEHPAAARLAILPGTPNDFFASPALASIVAPVIGASQIANRK